MKLNKHEILRFRPDARRLLPSLPEFRQLFRKIYRTGARRQQSSSASTSSRSHQQSRQPQPCPLLSCPGWHSGNQDSWFSDELHRAPLRLPMPCPQELPRPRKLLKTLPRRRSKVSLEPPALRALLSATPRPLLATRSPASAVVPARPSVLSRVSKHA